MQDKAHRDDFSAHLDGEYTHEHRLQLLQLEYIHLLYQSFDDLLCGIQQNIHMCVGNTDKVKNEIMVIHHYINH